jgi:histidyl-tRNA synthetase
MAGIDGFTGIVPVLSTDQPGSEHFTRRLCEREKKVEAQITRMKISAPRGTNDILPGESHLWHYVESVFGNLCRSFGYEEIRIPTFEHTELFLRGVGESTDVVRKEMYTFDDRAGRSLTLRPEGTAGVARAFVEHGMSSWPMPVKLCYDLNCFRYESVQKGRYREFWQFGCEIFGSSSPLADADVILLLHLFFDRLGLTRRRLEINNIGCPDCRPAYTDALKEYFAGRLDAMCGDCRERFQRNPLRMIDCKVDTCQAVVKDAPYQKDYLCDACRSHDETLKHRLDTLGVDYIENGRIVRGLDYYTKTVFEFVSENVGTQGTICGGGRYDGLIKEIGDIDVPGVGFALGVERLLMELKANDIDLPGRARRDLYLISFPSTEDLAAVLSNRLRELGIGCDIDLVGRSFKAQMKHAGRSGYRRLIVLGDDEVRKNEVGLKDLDSGKTVTVRLDPHSIADALRNDKIKE